MNLACSSKENSVVEVPKGIWTPFAKVLCYDCHGKTFKFAKYNANTREVEDLVLSDEEFNECRKSSIVESGYDVTNCDCCKKYIQVDKKLALEHNLNAKLNSMGVESCMYQSGGMCSAVSLDVKNGHEIIIIFEEYEEGDFWYCEEVDENGCLCDGLQVYFSSEDELINHILEFLNK